MIEEMNLVSLFFDDTNIWQYVCFNLFLLGAALCHMSDYPTEDVVSSPL
jgi:hypothetical protein